MLLVYVRARQRPFVYVACFAQDGGKPGGVAEESRRTYDQVPQVVLSLCVRSCVLIHTQAGLITGKDSSANGSWIIMPFWMFFLKLGCPYGRD